MRSLFYASTAVLAFATAPAGAADLARSTLPVKAPPALVAPAFTWTGFYLGANLGYGWADGSASTGIDADLFSVSYKPSGVIGGGQLGFNYQFENNLVLGIEADIELADMTDDSLYVDAGIIAIDGAQVPFDVSTGIKTDYFGTVRGRLGYAMDNMLFYGTGGFAWAHTKFNSGLLAAGAIEELTGLSSDQDKMSYGWVAGAGVEYAFSPNWTAKAEYLYSDFGSDTYSATYLGEVYSADVALTIQTVKLGVNYKF